MQHSLNSLTGYDMGAIDGEIGKVKEFYFDDSTWDIRYLVLQTGSWLFEREVLISPEALSKNSWKDGIFPQKNKSGPARISILISLCLVNRRLNYLAIIHGSLIGEAGFMQAVFGIHPMFLRSLMKR